MLTYAQTWLALRVDRRAMSPLEYGLTASVLVATLTAGLILFMNNSGDLPGR